MLKIKLEFFFLMVQYINKSRLYNISPKLNNNIILKNQNEDKVLDFHKVQTKN